MCNDPAQPVRRAILTAQDNGLLSHADVSVAMRLLEYAAAGELAAQREELTAMCRLTCWGAANRRLHRLEVAGIINVVRDGVVLVRFEAYRAESARPSTPERAESARPSTPHTGGRVQLQRAVPAPCTSFNSYLVSLVSSMEGRVEGEGIAWSTKLLTAIKDHNGCTIPASRAAEIAAVHDPDHIERSIYAWLGHIESGKACGIGALVNRLRNGWSAPPLSEVDLEGPLYRAIHPTDYAQRIEVQRAARENQQSKRKLERSPAKTSRPAYADYVEQPYDKELELELNPWLRDPVPTVQ